MNHKRRKFFKLLAFGGSAFVAGKIFGKSLDHLFAESGKETTFKNFRVVESGKELGVYESGGDQILVIDKDSF